MEKDSVHLWSLGDRAEKLSSTKNHGDQFVDQIKRQSHTIFKLRSKVIEEIFRNKSLNAAGSLKA